MPKNISKTILSAIFLLLVSVNNCIAGDELLVTVSPDAEITIERFTAKGEYLMLWLAPEYGLRDNHRLLAKKLAEQNIEVWMTNIVESLFLTQSLTSLKQIDSNYIAQIIEYAYKQTSKKIVLVGDSYAAISALMGAHQWQSRNPDKQYLAGAVLFTPFVYAYIPSLGLEAEYMPIVSASKIPIMIYQATKSSNTGQIDHLIETLQQHGSPVFSMYMRGIRSLFYTQDPPPEVLNKLDTLPANISKMIKLLDRQSAPTKAVALKEIKITKTGIDSSLKKYKANTLPLAIDLKNSDGKSITKMDYTGQVTVINFWATWCPPCIEEIPSLNRLKQAMKGLPFELISINYAEDNQTVQEFMKEVKIDFPVLMDSNGDFAKKWNVITYPSTFIINPQGKIIYGVNAAIEWDDPQVIDKIKSLF